MVAPAEGHKSADGEVILDKDIPMIGGGVHSRGLQRAWRRVQDTLTHGSPLLVDAKGRPATKLRTGGILDRIDTWEDLLPGRILDADGKTIRRPSSYNDSLEDILEEVPWSARELTVPFGIDSIDTTAQTHLLHEQLRHQGRKAIQNLRQTYEALTFTVDFPHQTVWMKRPPDTRSTLRKLWDRLAFRIWTRPLYLLERRWKALRSQAGEISEWWSERPWRAQEAAGNVFWSQGVEDDVRAQTLADLERAKYPLWEARYDDSPPGRFAGWKWDRETGRTYPPTGDGE